MLRHVSQLYSRSYLIVVFALRLASGFQPPPLSSSAVPSLSSSGCDQCARTPKCDVWVYCGSAVRCNTSYRQCWLKRNPTIWGDSHGSASQNSQPTVVVGISDRWISGSVTAAPLEHPSGAGWRPPLPSDADFVLSWGGACAKEAAGRDASNPNGQRVRIALRARTAPRAASRMRALVTSKSCRCGSEGDGESSRRIGRYFHDPCWLGGASAPHPGWGDENLPDGAGPGSRWEYGSALVVGSLGSLSSSIVHAAGREGAVRALEHSFQLANTSTPPAVEGGPTTVRRGSIFWLSSGARTGDGPAFGIALADHPHLGVSRTVWADVITEDMPLLDALATPLVYDGREMSGLIFPMSIELLPMNA